MTRFAHIIAIAFLLATMLGQSADAAFGVEQAMDCCDPETMQKMHDMHDHENGGCSHEHQCSGGDACCTQAIHSIPALMPSVDASSSSLFGQDSVEMAVLKHPNSAPVARFSEPPIA